MARTYTLSAVLPDPEVPLVDKDGRLTNEWRDTFEEIVTALFGPTGDDDVTQSIAGTITLGTETQGDYVESITGVGNMVVTGGTGEGSTPQVSIMSNPTFNNVSLNLVDGRDPSVDGVKLDGIALAATANSTDLFLLARTNHTGTQAWGTITGTPTTLSGYGITDGASDTELAGKVTKDATITAASETHSLNATFSNTEVQDALNALGAVFNEMRTSFNA